MKTIALGLLILIAAPAFAEEVELQRYNVTFDASCVRLKDVTTQLKTDSKRGAAWIEIVMEESPFVCPGADRRIERVYESPKFTLVDGQIAYQKSDAETLRFDPKRSKIRKRFTIEDIDRGYGRLLKGQKILTISIASE